MRVFCPEMDCLEGIMYGGGFVQGGFVRKWLMSRGSYVWRELRMKGVLSEGVLSEEVLSGGVFVRFVRAPFYAHVTSLHSGFHTAVEFYTSG